MRTFTLVDLEPQAFDAFSAAHPYGNFQQTSAMGAQRERRGIRVLYLGVLEDGELVAATQLEVHGSGISCFAEIHDGPMVDFRDAELLSFLVDGTAKRAREAGAVQLEVTPEAPYRLRDTNGHPLPTPDGDEPWLANVPAGADASANDEGVANLLALGFTHTGFNIGYTDVPRWRYLKDLSGISTEDELLASYAKKTLRNNIRIAASSGVAVRTIGRDDLPTFHGICELSCEKQGFENQPLEYLELLYDVLGDDIEFKVAYIDLASYIGSWREKRSKFLAQIEHLEGLLEKNPNSKKPRRQLADVQEQLGGAEKRIREAEELMAEVGKVAPAAAAAFAWHPRECVYLFSGADQRFARFYPAIAIQHENMLACIERGCTRYNFYGISGVFDDPDDPTAGLTEFKQGFGGYVEELMGSFTLVLKPGVYRAKKLARKLLGR